MRKRQYEFDPMLDPILFVLYVLTPILLVLLL